MSNNETKIDITTIVPLVQPIIDTESIALGVRTLFEPSAKLETRVLRTTKNNTNYQHRGTPEYRQILIDYLAETLSDTNAFGVYYTLNPIDPDAPDSNDYHSVRDEHILRRNWLLIDIDPVKADRHESATDEEKKAAQPIADRVMSYLTQEQQWPEPVTADSGNGYHLLFRVSLPNDEASSVLIHNVLLALDSLFSTDGAASIDTAVFNASRITKAYGTWSRKGTGNGDRPWRKSKIISVPESICVVTREQLETVAALAPEQVEVRAGKLPETFVSEEMVFDFVKFYDEKLRAKGLPGMAIHNAPARQNGATYYHLDWCPSAERTHGGVSAHTKTALVLGNTFGFSCFSDDCAKSTIGSVIANLERLTGAKYTRQLFKRANDLSKWSSGWGDWDPEEDTTVDEMAVYESAPRSGKDENAGRKFVRPREVLLDENDKVFHLTDTGNQFRFVRRFGHGFMYCAEDRMWMTWAGKRWLSDSLSLVKLAVQNTVLAIPDESAVRILTSDPLDDKPTETAKSRANNEFWNWCRDSESEARRSSMERLSQPALAHNKVDFDANQWLFNVQNGTVNLRTSVLQKHNPNDMLTKISPVVFDPDADCPKWKQFVIEIMDGKSDVIKYLQRIAGYTLTGDKSYHSLIMLWGDGSNGKSTFLEVMHYIISEYAHAAAMSSFLAKDNDSGPGDDLAALAGARFVTAVENAIGAQLNEAKVKQVTGEDTISVRHLYGRYFQMKPRFKLWMATNHRPYIKDTTNSIWRRVKLIPFNVTFHEPPADPRDRKPCVLYMNKTLPQELMAESAGILNWMLAGLADFLQDGPQEPAEVTLAGNEYRDSQDKIGMFLQDETMNRGDKDQTTARTSARDVYVCYSAWATRGGGHPLSEIKFSEAMAQRGVKKVQSNGRKFYCLYLKSALDKEETDSEHGENNRLAMFVDGEL